MGALPRREAFPKTTGPLSRAALWFWIAVAGGWGLLMLHQQKVLRVPEPLLVLASLPLLVFIALCALVVALAVLALLSPLLRRR